MSKKSSPAAWAVVLSALAVVLLDCSLRRTSAPVAHAKGDLTAGAEQFFRQRAATFSVPMDGDLQLSAPCMFLSFATLPDVSQHISFWLNSLVPGSYELRLNIGHRHY
jgi:hypothetical protein